MITRRRWTEVELQLLREEFADSRTDDLARALGRPYTSVAQKAATLGLRKSAAFYASPAARRYDVVTGLHSRFQPGLTPWNKGSHYKAGGRSADTRFKPGTLNGQAARLVVPVGTYRVDFDGFLQLKVADTPGPQTLRWRAVHRIVWEQAHGPVPAGHVVAFKGGKPITDPALITPDTLELISRRELMARNTFHRYGPEAAKVIQLRGAITRQINKRLKESA